MGRLNRGVASRISRRVICKFFLIGGVQSLGPWSEMQRAILRPGMAERMRRRYLSEDFTNVDPHLEDYAKALRKGVRQQTSSNLRDRLHPRLGVITTLPLTLHLSLRLTLLITR